LTNFWRKECFKRAIGFRKWIDPTGENPQYSGVDNSKRPYPRNGTWERYSFQVGNILFLMMGDRNDSGPPAGREERGGYPAGAVSRETFEWWKNRMPKFILFYWLVLTAKYLVIATIIKHLRCFFKLGIIRMKGPKVFWFP
jgi:hypothetical protein